LALVSQQFLHLSYIVVQSFQQITYAVLEYGVFHVWRDFSQGLQYKSPVMHCRMGHVELRRVND